tara:strand:- start:1235 stop:2038 length:804 start_codon:yes stop_codon:yes gene_type:complete
MGSLITALASYLDIKSKKGLWLIRIDDLDPPRTAPGATQAILESLFAHGLVSDRAVIYQSENLRNYESQLAKLLPHIYSCECSRKILARHKIYPGTCRDKVLSTDDFALRIRVPNTLISFNDKIRGETKTNLQQEVGDFIVVRRDKLFSYNLATACDDGDQGITDVLRGEDLLLLTNPQIFLMNMLKLKTPEYSHIPVLCNINGQKLSKQAGAPPVKNFEAVKNLTRAMRFLGFTIPEHIKTVNSVIEWGIRNWSANQIPKQFDFYS